MRDPAAVSVRVPSKDGTGAVILPAGNEPIEVPLPAGEPPYQAGAWQHGFVLRSGGHGLTLRCDECVGSPAKTALPDDGVLRRIDSWSGPLPPIVVVRGDTAMIGRVSNTFTVREGKGHKTRPAFSVDLETPTSNLIYARRSGGDTHVGGWVGAAMGVLVLGASSFLFVEGASAHTSGNAAAFYASGGLTALLGASVLVVSIPSILRAPIDEVAWPPPTPAVSPEAPAASETPEKQP